MTALATVASGERQRFDERGGEGVNFLELRLRKEAPNVSVKHRGDGER